MPDTNPTQARLREETAEAVCEVAICLAQAIHEIDPDAHRRMNFNAGKAYNRLLGQKRDTLALSDEEWQAMFGAGIAKPA